MINKIEKKFYIFIENMYGKRDTEVVYGYIYKELNIGIHKINGKYKVTDLASGLCIIKNFNSEQEALKCYKERWQRKVDEQRQTDKYQKIVKEFNKLNSFFKKR